MEIVHELSNIESFDEKILRKLKDCFVVPPRNDTFFLAFNEMWVMDSVSNLTEVLSNSGVETAVTISFVG